MHIESAFQCDFVVFCQSLAFPPSLFLPLHISHEKRYFDAVLSGHSFDAGQILQTDFARHQQTEVDRIQLTQNVDGTWKSQVKDESSVCL